MNRCPNCMKELPVDLTRCPECGYEKNISNDNCLMPGTVLKERYYVGRVLGAGGFGKTYVGYDEKIDSKVAIKEYLPSNLVTHVPGDDRVVVSSEKDSSEFENGKKRFMEEAARLAQVGGEPEIVQVYDYFEENNTAYIVMEFLSGETLLEKLKREGRLKTEEALAIMDEVLKGLIKVHERGLLHRDIAPDNIYLCNDGKVKLFDFGSARTMNSGRTRSMAQEIKKGYSPPEQYSSEKNKGTWTDVYAAAATCYRMVTGTKPPQALERIGNHAKKTKKPSEYGIRIKKPVENAIMNALQPEISKRTQTAEEFRKQLSDSNTRLVSGGSGKTDLGNVPLWIKILVPVAAAVLIGFGGLLATGTIRFDTATAGKQQLAEGMIRIPNLVNLSVTDAMGKAETGGFSIKISDKEYSDTIPISRILYQDIGAGSIAEEGTVVEVILSAGIEQTYAPYLTGLSRDEIEAVLLDQGFKAEYVYEDSFVCPEHAASQDPAADTALNTGDTIRVTLSKGHEGMKKPAIADTLSLTGLSWSEALKEAETKGFYLTRKETVYSSEPGNTIIAQALKEDSVSGGIPVIETTVSAGRERTLVPDLSGNTEDSAKALLEAAVLQFEITYEESSDVEKGRVIRQDLKAGERVPQETVISVAVSSGEPEPETTAAPVNTQPRQNAPQAAPQPQPQTQPQGGEPPTIMDNNG